MANWRDRLTDAQSFWDVAEAARDSEHTNQAASNAILGAIAANDAVCLFLGQSQPSGDSHTEAAVFLREACKNTRWEEESGPKAQQLLNLVRQKSAAQYHGSVFTIDETDRVMKQAERFIRWAESVLPPGS